ncbi:alcohol dehydrogenase catalytic domain-containing protein [Dactylosporangium sp. NPDC005572]|uniref:alcohol dehydrogenase catalytic domain-containing protein n=1 Tax=Dactylosporangium sp. NPDC005572 TaxID=3156889 RepID=UPI0033B2DF75
MVYEGPRRVRVRCDLPEPPRCGPGDALVRVTCAAICGTDLHPYRGEIPGFAPGTVLGHEFVGTVVAAGADAGHRPGDEVFASDLISCGTCRVCARGWHYQCPSATLFGYSTVVGAAVDGGQADLVLVPHAAHVLARRPASVTPEQALFVCDTLTTAHTAIRRSSVTPGDSVAVVGGGPVGLLSAMCAREAGAARVVVADPLPARRAAAEALGFAAVAPDGLADALAASGGPADAVVEAVGSSAALAQAMLVAGPRGRIAVVGAHHATDAPLPTGTGFARELTVRFVVGDPIADRAPALELISSGRLDPAALVSHRFPLDEAPAAYDLFDRGGALKVVLYPGYPG